MAVNGVYVVCLALTKLSNNWHSIAYGGFGFYLILMKRNNIETRLSMNLPIVTNSLFDRTIEVCKNYGYSEETYIKGIKIGRCEV